MEERRHVLVQVFDSKPTTKTRNPTQTTQTSLTSTIFNFPSSNIIKLCSNNDKQTYSSSLTLITGPLPVLQLSLPNSVFSLTCSRPLHLNKASTYEPDFFPSNPTSPFSESVCIITLASRQVLCETRWAADAAIVHSFISANKRPSITFGD